MIGVERTANMSEIKASITKRAIEIMEEGDADGQGICLACGEEADSFVEPDAEDYHCEACGESSVYGLEQIILLSVA
jgi:hypothetical protein